MSVSECPRCFVITAAGARYCPRCGIRLDANRSRYAGELLWKLHRRQDRLTKAKDARAALLKGKRHLESSLTGKMGTAASARLARIDQRLAKWNVRLAKRAARVRALQIRLDLWRQHGLQLRKRVEPKAQQGTGRPPASRRYPFVIVTGIITGAGAVLVGSGPAAVALSAIALFCLLIILLGGRPRRR